MMSGTTFFFDNLWSGLVVWVVLYVSDYTFTLACARLYRQGVCDKIVFDGSFELNPYFQADIDSLRVVSPRFVAALIIGLAYFAAIHWLAAESQPGLYEFVLGAAISSELAIHVRHLRNLFLFRAIARGEDIQGRIHYSRSIILQMSSVELLGFSVLFGVTSIFTSSWFLMGGTAACVALALKHWRQANKQSGRGKNEVFQTRQEPALPDRIEPTSDC